MTILVVEDNPHISELFAEALGNAGYAVEISDNGADAVMRLAQGDYQLVLMDLSLPDMNGAEVACCARQAGDQTPMIAVTGALPLIEEDRLIDAKFTAVIGKPVRVSALLDMIKMHSKSPQG